MYVINQDGSASVNIPQTELSVSDTGFIVANHASGSVSVFGRYESKEQASAALALVFDAYREGVETVQMGVTEVVDP